MDKQNQPFDDIDVCDDFSSIDVAAGAIGPICRAAVHQSDVIHFSGNVFDQHIIGDNVAVNVDNVHINIECEEAIHFDNVGYNVDDAHVNVDCAEADIHFKNEEAVASFASSQPESAPESFQRGSGFESRASIVRRSLYSHECICKKIQATPRERQVIT